MKILTFTITFLILIISASAQVNNYFQIDLEKRMETISLKMITIKPFAETQENSGAQYFVELVSSQNQILNRGIFGFPDLIFYDTIDPQTGEINGGGSFIRNESTTTLYLPYYPNAKEINIYDQNLTLKLRIPVQQFAREKSVEAQTTNKQQEKSNQEGEASTPRSITIPIIAGIILILIITSLFILIRIRRTP